MAKTIFWFRRDLRFEDNTGLLKALSNSKEVIALFIFDLNILNELPADDARVNFIYQKLKSMHEVLNGCGSSMLVQKGEPTAVWNKLIDQYDIEDVYVNKDYEPYARKRDSGVQQLLEDHHINFYQFKDQVIFEEDEVVKDDGKPYHVFTPYKRKWLSKFTGPSLGKEVDFRSFYKFKSDFPSLQQIGFDRSDILVKDPDLSRAEHYGRDRDFPGRDATSHLGPHLRFGTLSIRKVINQLKPAHEVFLSELIWREFFMQILYHYPRVVHENFKTKYNGIQWLNNESDFEKWCTGQTGYPMVDAGMRELNATGFMHNRVRMVVAGFLCKHLLIDWRWGESYFALKLLDYELSSNNGNWQWAAGTGCDAAPYFRIFNPESQLHKFDKEHKYVNRWIPELGQENYPEPMIDHKFARNRALETYKRGIII